ncbi:MAG: AcrR family transcriptional regulator [Oceanicoccus sp.]|jgi:AcrR family transcriptional regulator
MTFENVTSKMIKKKYHHGDLATSLVQAAVALLREKGPASLSLRAVARVAGVSHGAPAHHFGDKTGLLTAVATEGHDFLAEALRKSQARKKTPMSRLAAAGKAYVKFAISQPAYFSTMFQFDLLDCEDPGFVRASFLPKQILEQCVRALEENVSADERQIQSMVISRWSQVHGFATLWMMGSFGSPDDSVLLEVLLSEMMAEA